MLKQWGVKLAGVVLLMAAVRGAEAQEILEYQVPPKGIVELVDTLPTPSVMVSPVDHAGKRWLLIEPLSGLPPISALAQPELRLAGLRFNPRTNGPSRGRYGTSLRLKALPSAGRRSRSGTRLPDRSSSRSSW